MSDSPTLRRLRSEIPDPSPEQLAGQRLRLMREFSARAEERPAAEQPQRGDQAPLRALMGPRRSSFLAVAGLAVAAAVVATVLLPVTLREGAHAEAADTLEQAALRSISASDPDVPPGGYLRVTTEALSGAAVAVGTGPAGAEDAARAADSAGIDTVDLYIPHDPDEGWVEVRVVPQADGGPAQQATAVDESWTNQEDEMSQFLALPEDPEAALALIRSDLGQQSDGRMVGTDAGRVFDTVSNLLRDGLLPAERRALAYRILALLPGVMLGETAASLGERNGVVIGLTSAEREEPPRRMEIIVDPVTGAFLGERTVQLDGSGRASGVLTQTLVRTEVVSVAPRVVTNVAEPAH
ncbi:hypothetical protein [Leucobacter sp. M11]|uniref:hypothetical protein n=1 Tax=Leucobacter sp. M11 TaxID=2993565 RepID=UPI002D7F03A5|nr:hypothetical protein [Leucobacter sp. M11]MEB4615181.1 hypothetical protein [Leucobacter sp. M11]